MGEPALQWSLRWIQVTYGYPKRDYQKPQQNHDPLGQPGEGNLGNPLEVSGQMQAAER